MHNTPIDQIAGRLVRQLPTGVFLCVGGPTPNVMTVGWGGLAYYWRKDVFVAPIRPQRHTHPLLLEEGAFTISVPAPGEMAGALAQAGSLSGRDGDKFARAGLQTLAARQVDAPVVEGCAFYLECAVRARNAFDAAGMDGGIATSVYPAGDFHTLFYGEIVACYTAEDMW